MQELMSLFGKEVVADGDWRPCGTAEFFGDVKRNQDRGFCTVVKEHTAIDVILDNRAAVTEEKRRNDIQDDRIQALEHNVEVLMSHLPGHCSDSDLRDSAPFA